MSEHNSAFPQSAADVASSIRVDARANDSNSRYSYRDRCEKLVANGYTPVPITSPRAPGRGAGKRPIDRGWQEQPRSVILQQSGSRRYQGCNIGVRADGLVGIDVDTDDPCTKAAVWSAVHVADPVIKKGRVGGTIVFGDPTGSFKTTRIDDLNGRRIVDILAGSSAQFVVPPSTHPDTFQPYDWLTARTLYDTPIDDLPIITERMFDDLMRATGPFCRLPIVRPQPAAPSVEVADLNSQLRLRYERQALKILSERAADLAHRRDGQGRNWALYTAVCRLGVFIHHGLIDQSLVTRALGNAYKSCGAMQDHGAKQFLMTVRGALERSQHDRLPKLKERSW